MSASPSNTGSEQGKKKKPVPPVEHQFKKGDPRINRNGRPKRFDDFRRVVQEKLNEVVFDSKGHPVLDKNGKQVTQLDLLIVEMMQDPRHRQYITEVGFGKVPQETVLDATVTATVKAVDVSALSDDELQQIIDLGGKCIQS